MSVEAFILLQMEHFYWDQNNLFSQNIEGKSPSRSIKIVLPHYHAICCLCLFDLKDWNCLVRKEVLLMFKVLQQRILWCPKLCWAVCVSPYNSLLQLLSVESLNVVNMLKTTNLSVAQQKRRKQQERKSFSRPLKVSGAEQINISVTENVDKYRQMPLQIIYFIRIGGFSGNREEMRRFDLSLHL